MSGHRPPDKPGRRHLRVAYDAQAALKPPTSCDGFRDLIPEMGAEQAGEPSPPGGDIWQDIADGAYVMDGQCLANRCNPLQCLLRALPAGPGASFELYAVARLIEVILRDGISPDPGRSLDGPDGAP